MKSMPDLLRFARLALLLMLVPNIRSCDDASGMSQTSGFPLPYASHSNGGLSFAGMDWAMLAVDVLFFVLLALLLMKRFPDWLTRLASLRVFLVAAFYAVFNLLFGWVVFFALLLPAVGLNALVPIYLGAYMDIASRLVLIGVVALAMLVLTHSHTQPTGTGNG